MRLSNPDKGAVVRRPGYDGVKSLTNPPLHGNRSHPFGHFTLNFSRSIFLFRAVRRDKTEFAVGIWIAPPRKHGLEHPLTDHVGEAPVGRGGVSVILNREAEVSGGRF